MKAWVISLIVIAGWSFGPVSLAADFNGDGRDDIAVFRPSIGLWAVRGVTRVYFGGSGDNPVPADYNHDGRAVHVQQALQNRYHADKKKG